MRISLIAAKSENGVIGKDNKLPWHLPEDLKYFKKMTLGKPVIMGRKTFESMGSKPLPNRENIVLTRYEGLVLPGCIIVNSVEGALAAAGSSAEAMVIGGAEIYSLFLPIADRLYLSIIPQIIDGDSFFPKLDMENWQLVSEEKHIGFTTQIFDRKPHRG